ncbi:hypothetical protein B0H11DRAFT_2269000 [Mycena galericulata]|nr:hypothetical protein B0H11DRAFT_2269000 [Mycena galericulata]
MSLAPELVEHCIGLLAENVHGRARRLVLMSCALVARSWVNVAQSALLRAPHVTNYFLLDDDRSQHPLVRLHETLHTFPHLTHHVRDLSLDLIVDSLITQTTLDNICTLPFTHLESVSLFVRKDLDYESALSIRDQKGVPVERFVKTVRVLDIYDTAGEQAIDFSTFPNLSVLRVSLNESISPAMLSTLSTVASSSIRTIIIDLNFYDRNEGYSRRLSESEYPALDAILSALPMPDPPSIEFEVTHNKNWTNETVMKSFPASRARDMLRLVHRREDVSDTW